MTECPLDNTSLFKRSAECQRKVLFVDNGGNGQKPLKAAQKAMAVLILTRAVFDEDVSPDSGVIRNGLDILPHQNVEACHGISKVIAPAADMQDSALADKHFVRQRFVEAK